MFRLPEHVVVLEALLNSWQGCWLGFLLKWGCGIGSVAVQVLWQSLVVGQDWRLYSAVGQGCEFASLPRWDRKMSSMAGIAYILGTTSDKTANRVPYQVRLPAQLCR